MRTHTVIVTWLVRSRGGYRQGSRTFRGIRATSCGDAGRQALAALGDRIGAAVSCVWYDWPVQPVAGGGRA